MVSPVGTASEPFLGGLVRHAHVVGPKKSEDVATFVRGQLEMPAQQLPLLSNKRHQNLNVASRPGPHSDPAGLTVVALERRFKGSWDRVSS